MTNAQPGRFVMDTVIKNNPVKLLIVDDHPNTAAMLARVLSKFDTPVEITTASGGEEALELVGDQGVDILITDFMMPGVNGLELIEKLKGSQKPAHIILITAYDTPGLAISAQVECPGLFSEACTTRENPWDRWQSNRWAEAIALSEKIIRF